jgi:hypothetical protein
MPILGDLIFTSYLVLHIMWVLKYLFRLYVIPGKTFTQSQLELILSVSQELYSSMPKMEEYVYAR